MARKSERLSSNTKVTASHKRTVSATATPRVATKRAKTTQSTPEKSPYFESGQVQGSDRAEVEDADSVSNDEPSPTDEDVSEFGNDEDVESREISEPEDDDDYNSDEDSKRPKKAPSKSRSVKTTATKSGGGELWRPGVKTGLAPGTQVVIKKPTARSAGKTPYTDRTIHPNTLLFLQDLKANNDRQWLKMHDADFRTSEKDWHGFVEQLTEKLVDLDDSVPELPVKDIIFRIYRDIRFSSDPTPYKTHFSAAWSRTGRKGPYAHYYLKISPDDSFLGGGLWHPDAAQTAAMRRDIDQHPRRIKSVLMENGLRQAFFKGVPKQEAKVVKAFVASNAENALKTKPKGYAADHPDIELLRLRDYTIGRKITDEEVLGDEGLDRIAALLACIKPFITYLNSVVMPDEDGEEDRS